MRRDPFPLLLIVLPAGLLGLFVGSPPFIFTSLRLKNEASMFSQTVRSFNMQHRLLLTGTPLQVEQLLLSWTFRIALVTTPTHTKTGPARGSRLKNDARDIDFACHDATET